MSSVNGSKLPLHVVRDNAKWVFLPTKVILALTILWPENHSKLLLWFQWFSVASYLYFMCGNLHFAAHTNSDITLIILAFTFFIVQIEALSRYYLLMTKREKLSNLLHILYHEFWPSDIVGERVNKELLVESRKMIFIISFYTFSAFNWGFQCIANAVFFKYLPLSTTYPYAWSKSPYYELMLCFQSYFAVNIPIVVCAGDWLVVSILSVCVAQFKLLKTYVRENIQAAILNDQKYKTQNAKVMLRFALNHHKKLIKVSEDVNDIFQYFILLQFLTSTVTVCVSTFVITFLPNERLTGITYFTGHIFEIFIYCYMGSELLYEIHETWSRINGQEFICKRTTELVNKIVYLLFVLGHSLYFQKKIVLILIFWSADLSNCMFHCGWHLTDTDIDFKKSLILGMVRSQEAIKVKAGGFGFLQLNTFLNLVKFSFSVFTLLRSLMKKQDGNI